jgi:cell division protein FtsB
MRGGNTCLPSVKLRYNASMADIPQQPPTTRKRKDQLSSLQVMFAAILAIGLLLAINFSSRITAGQPLLEARERAASEIERLKREQAQLLVERDYARSDAFVQQWARNDGKMVREGEILVVPVPAGSAATQVETVNEPRVPVETTPPRPETWQVWWALFFDVPPPDFE